MTLYFLTDKLDNTIMKTNEISSYLENICLLLLGVLFFAFPLVITPSTTDIFMLPKQIALGAVFLLTLLLFGAKMISDGAVRLRRTPFDLPVLLFAIFTLLSALFSLNRYDSLIAFVPLLFSVLTYFVIVNFARNKDSLLFLVYALIGAASVISLLSILSFFKIYVLPFPFTKIQTFSPLGSILDQTIYLAVITALIGFFVLPIIKKGEQVFQKNELNESTIALIAGFILVLGGLIVTLYELFTLQKPILLPLETGFQTAFAAISQDPGRTIQGLLLGSGIGTYATDFTRFKQAAFNANQDLWSLTFFRSSNFVLELLATAGVLGVASFILLIVKIIKYNPLSKAIKENPIFASLLLLIVLSFIFPLSFVNQAVLFLLIGLFASYEALKSHHKFYDIELNLVAFKKGIIASSPLDSNGQPLESVVKQDSMTNTKILPVFFFLIFAAFVGMISFYAVRFVSSDIIFQNSLVAAAANNGIQTYNDQTNAIRIFPYRDAYHRIYSQTNLALANSLAASQPKDSSPSAQVQQTIFTLIQQSINSARNATAISPLSVANWQNLASIYRGLIGFGQNAENFSILTSQQAIILDPNNPREYIDLGGIYYQLGQWDNAQRQFQIAVNLKPDFANAYYNLGHALEQKQDYQNALIQYQAVKTLIANDKEALKKIDAEIEVLQKKIGAALNAANQEQSQTPQTTATAQPPLGLSTPSTQLPEQKKPVEIPAPTVIIPSVSPSPSASPSPTVKP